MNWFSDRLSVVDARCGYPMRIQSNTDMRIERSKGMMVQKIVLIRSADLPNSFCPEYSQQVSSGVKRYRINVMYPVFFMESLPAEIIYFLYCLYIRKGYKKQIQYFKKISITVMHPFIAKPSGHIDFIRFSNIHCFRSMH